MKAIINANVVLETGILWDGVILIDGDRILKAASADEVQLPADACVIDAAGAYVGPGFVDIHVHGAFRQTLFDNPHDIARHFLMHGETTILPTSILRPYDEFLQGIRRVMDAAGTAKNIKGINMEFPYCNPNYGSSKNLDLWNKEPINEARYKPLVDALGSFAKIWTIAPEREGLISFLEYARKVNPDTVFSIGHSEAFPAQIRALGTKYRPRLMTHIMNATGRQSGGSGIRGYGPDEYCLAEPEMFAELISDSLGFHVSADLQRMVVQCKGINRVVLITDATHRRTDKKPTNCAHAEDLNFNNAGLLSGSNLTMNAACRNIMRHTNCGIAQAFIMASLNPAKVIGMDREIGSIEPGKIADLVFVDDRFNVLSVMQAGQMCSFDTMLTPMEEADPLL